MRFLKVSAEDTERVCAFDYWSRGHGAKSSARSDTAVICIRFVNMHIFNHDGCPCAHGSSARGAIPDSYRTKVFNEFIAEPPLTGDREFPGWL